jgi:hypothetical protein
MAVRNRSTEKPAASAAVVPLRARGSTGRPVTPDAPYSEKELQNQILDLVAGKNTDRATKVLIDALPAIYQSNVNSKEKLNNLLFLARVIQHGGGSKHGHVKLRNKLKTLTNCIGTEPVPAGGFLELGCGAHDPLAMAMFFYLNGLTPAYGVDLLPPRTAHFSALSMYEILAHVKMFPGRYVWGGKRPIDIINQLRTIDSAAFERGDFQAGLESVEGRVNLLSEDLLTCAIAPASIALLTSFAVFEHLTDIDAIFRRCFELMVPGGIAYHFIDLADHRSYRGDGQFGPLSFLTEEHAPANMNRQRAPQFVAAARRAGFDIVKDQRGAGDLTEALQAQLVAPFDAMAPADVAVIKQHLLLRKPL